jgi:hypothetical protein
MNTEDLLELDKAEQISPEIAQHNLSNLFPTASEVGNLFATYLAENMSVCMLKFMVAKSKDPDIKPVLQQALFTSSERIQSMETLFEAIHHPLPEGFGEKDVNIDVPELFSETFSLAYTRIMNVYIELKYVYSLSRSYRSDFRDFFAKGIITAREIYQKSTDVLLAKGLISKSPYITIPDKIDKIETKTFYGSLFGGKRPLNAVEISHLYHSIETRILFSTLELAFCQAVKNEKIKDQLFKGHQIYNEQVNVLSSFFKDEHITVPAVQFQVTQSKESPFSDKLILFHSATVAGFSLLDIGFGLSSSSRKDIMAAFNRLILEIQEYCKDGTDLMILNGWLEQVPESPNRKELIFQ